MRISSFPVGWLSLLIAGVTVSLPPAFAQAPATHTQSRSCPADTGLTLPPGFCATVFAEDLGFARHMAVAPNGTVYVNTWSGQFSHNTPPPPGGFIVALRDTDGTGKANVIERFGKSAEDGAHGGVGIALYRGYVYVEESERIERYALPSDSINPKASPEVVVSDMPMGGDHPMHPFIIDRSGGLYVDMGSATNACQEQNRQLRSAGIRPCTELETRGGIWRFDANKLNQKFSPGARFAAGIRNGEGIAIDAAGALYATQHGRDQLYLNWPELYKPEEEATLPAEELVRLRRGADYGWPECYYDQIQRKLVLAPEYGGDGGKTVGGCAHKIAPAAAFPAHWAPNDLVIYTGTSFPKRYRNGAFIAFHGSWDRAPYPQGGYNVVFQPFTRGGAHGRCEIFADGFAGEVKDPGGALRRPSGLAVGPDGALYISEDQHGRIYRVTYQGGASAAGALGTPCPPADAPAGEISAKSAAPPEGEHADAEEAATLPVPTGATREMVEKGDEIFHGRVGGATCTGCHGSDAKGTPLGPDLTSKSWIWGDGSYPSITNTIRDGVSQPRQYRDPMPPMGGAQLTAEQVSAVAAYVWALAHR